MTRYATHVNAFQTPQTEQVRPNQVKNNAGGYVFQITPWQQLERFLILGSAGGTYYVGERAMTKENAAIVDRCLAEDPSRTIRTIVEISDSGRAPKNDPAIFALAVAASSLMQKARAEALSALPKVCRTATHLFAFVSDCEQMRKWSRSLRSAVSRWYTDRSADSLALQLVKYQQRNGWAHRDVMRLAHPTAPSQAHLAAMRWSVGGTEAFDQPVKRGRAGLSTDLPALIVAFEKARKATSVSEIVSLIRDERLPHEAVPNEWKGKLEVWEAILDAGMGQTALIRNLAKMTSVGLIKPLGDVTARIAAQLTDQEQIRRGRVHPMAYLIALGVYRQGHGDKGKLSWTPVRDICDALDAGFYESFKTVEPTGKKHLLALDVSGSMSATIAGTSLSCREAAAAMAMVTARAEKHWHVVGFTAATTGARDAYGRYIVSGYGGQWGGGDPSLTPIDISPRDRIDDVCSKTRALPMGGTDCSLPMRYATRQDLDVDCFVVLTDNETYAGSMHPYQALLEYRRHSGRNAKLVVMGMTASSFTIADPSDSGTMDVVGLDANTPAVIADFVRQDVNVSGGNAA